MKRLFFLSWFLSISFLFLFSCFQAFAADDPIAEIDRQRALVSRFNQEVEREQLLREAGRQADEKRLAAIRKKRDEARISAQFAGLSNKLSGLPEIPSFEGKFTAGSSSKDQN